MTYLFLGSTGDQAGQSLISWAIARRLLENNIRTGFFKPIGTSPVQVNDTRTDRDAVLFKKVLNLPEPLEKICPYPDPDLIPPEFGPEHILDYIKRLADDFSRERDIVLIGGSKHIFFDNVPHMVPDASFIWELKAGFILVHRYRRIATTLYSILSVISLFKDIIKGVIINRVPNEELDRVKAQIVPLLEKKGASNLIIIPEDPFLSSKSIEGISKILRGRIICGNEYTDRLVGALTVSTSGLDRNFSFLKRIYNKIILMEQSSVSGKIAGVILTGNREPPEQIVQKSIQLKLPLLLVKEDSFKVMERLETGATAISYEDEGKAFHITALMDENDSLNKMIRSLGITS